MDNFVCFQERFGFWGGKPISRYRFPTSLFLEGGVTREKRRNYDSSVFWDSFYSIDIVCGIFYLGFNFYLYPRLSSFRLVYWQESIISYYTSCFYYSTYKL